VDTIDNIFRLSSAVRYVALYRNGKLSSRERPDLTGGSSAESDRYEELIVNPALLTLAKQRGDIDCGGARFVLVGYGKFQQLMLPVPGGHVSVGFDLAENPIRHAAAIAAMF
jgi:hypothetical protein